MDYDISQSIPQGSDGAQEAENLRIAAIADELCRLCRVHETQPGSGERDVDLHEVEQRAAEQMAKSGGFWIPMMEILVLRRLPKKVVSSIVSMRYGICFHAMF